jgi:hypothetical protein
MPEADYGFKPGTTAEVRTFGQAMAHVAQAQFGQCSGINGVPNPMQGKNLEQELKTKAEITKALADSFALCDTAFAATTDENAVQFIKQGQNEATRRAALYGVIVHGSRWRHRVSLACARRTSSAIDGDAGRHARDGADSG